MSYLEHLSKIDTIILDVDGVLTDSLLHVLEDGKLLRRMHTRDGYAL
jgi:3-deoxy-D-manno-octulosonate 8-phosphate phosphatase (KDO 8-P phosphatase)